MANLIDGRAQAAALRVRIGAAVAHLSTRHQMKIGLHVVLVGDDAASHIYVKNKARACAEAGIIASETRLPATTSEDDLCTKIAALNADKSVHGILVQFPAPPHMSQQRIINTIAADKDVDGLHPLNFGRLAAGAPYLVPCTPLGCLHLARRAYGDLGGAHAVIIGRSNLVGKPLAHLFLNANATVTLAHSKTRDLPSVAREGDILVAAVGRAALVKGDWIKSGACVLDVGINRGADGLVGDVEFAEAIKRAGAITPVPGGVGPMTIACLLHNTVRAACHQNGVDTPAMLG